MSAIVLIREHISKRPNQLISRKEFLQYGPEKAVDDAVHRLTQSGELHRETRGVYSLKGSRNFSIFEIATFKANVFGRKIISHAAQIARELEISDRAIPPHTFMTDGRTSSFKVRGAEVVLKGTSRRKMALGDNPVGKVVRAIWQMGADKVDVGMIAAATRGFSIAERIEMGGLCSLMPGWLSDFVFSWNFLPRKNPAGDKTQSRNVNDCVREQPVAYDCRRALPLQRKLTMVRLR